MGVMNYISQRKEAFRQVQNQKREIMLKGAQKERHKLSQEAIVAQQLEAERKQIKQLKTTIHSTTVAGKIAENIKAKVKAQEGSRDKLFGKTPTENPVFSGFKNPFEEKKQ